MTLKTWFILVPCVIVGLVLTLANLSPVQFSLDPFSAERPALAVTVPLFVVIMAAFLSGLLAGGFGAWIGQHRNRHEKRVAQRELKRVHKQRLAAANANDSTSSPSVALTVPNASRNVG